MADFKVAYDKTAVNEGNYSNDPTDRGGETWRGIARKMHPKWKGWVIVDSFKKYSDFINRLKKSDELQVLVLDFYKEEFWDKVWGDRIINQDIANMIYDNCVNIGIPNAIRLAERVAGIKEDGIMDNFFTG